MKELKIITVSLLLCCFTVSNGQTTQESVYSKKETLYSTKNGRAIGELLLTIAPKNATANNTEWILTIGEKGEKFFDTRNERTLWIFNNKQNVNELIKELKKRDYALEVKGIREILPFCENGIQFNLKEWDELRKQTQVTFSLKASPGERVLLRLVFYAATPDKKKTAIDDEVRLRVFFDVPDFSAARATQTQSLSQPQPQRSSGGSGGIGFAQEVRSSSPAPVEEQQIEPEIAAQQREAQRQDSLARVEAANKEQRVILVNTFITERNREINTLQSKVNALLDDKLTPVSESTIDSLLTLADAMKEKVDFWEKGYTDILLVDESIHDKFSKFRIAHALTLKKIDEIKDKQKPFSGIRDFIKNNLMLSAGIGIFGIIFLKFFITMVKKLQSFIKTKINRKINKAKSDAKKRMAGQPEKWKQRRKREEDYDDTDIKNLTRI